jgi:hypothetical protein
VSLADRSHVLYPSVMARFWPGAELTVGALLLRGDDDSKFGTAVTGPSQWQAKLSYAF